MIPHPDLLLEQAKLQQSEWRREAELILLAREARRYSDRSKSSPLHAGQHQIGRKRNWRAERALFYFLKAVFPLSTIEYLASHSPTETVGATMGTLKALTDDGLFRGQSQAFFRYLNGLAAADRARH